MGFEDEDFLRSEEWKHNTDLSRLVLTCKEHDYNPTQIALFCLIWTYDEEARNEFDVDFTPEQRVAQHLANKLLRSQGITIAARLENHKLYITPQSVAFIMSEAQRATKSRNPEKYWTEHWIRPYVDKILKTKRELS